MQKSLHINPDKCTGCLQCEMACSFENYGIYATAKSRIKVFDFHHTGRKVPYTCTQCDEAWCLHACPVEAITLDKVTGAKVVNETTCVGCKVCTIACPFGTINYVQETGKVQKCDLCGGEPACADACPTGAITFVDANWTGLDKMKAVGRQARQPALRDIKEHQHVLGWKNPPRQPDRRHRQVRAAEHGLGARLPRLARPGHQVPRRRDRPQGRSAVAGEQDHLGHRPADRHHGLHRRPLHRGHQGPADRRHRLLQLGRLLGRRAEDGRLGHGHLRRQVRQAGVPLHPGRRGRVARRRAPVGHRASGRPKRRSRSSTRIR